MQVDAPTKHPEATNEGIAKFISTLRVHMSVPIAAGDPRREEKERLWFTSMAQTLRPFCDEILVTGASRILHETRGTDRRFPMPGQIVRVLEDIAEDLYRKPLLAKQMERERASPASRDRTRLVVDLLRGREVTNRAMQGNWLLSLVEFVRERMMLPDDQQERGLIVKGQDFDELRGRCHAGVGWPSVFGGIHPWARVWARYADSMEAKAQLWGRVLRGEESEQALWAPLDMSKGP